MNAPRKNRSAVWGSVVALVFVGGSLALFRGPARPYTVVGRAPVVAPLAIGAMLVLLVAGLAVASTHPHWRSGSLLLGGACAGCLPAWVGWEGAAPVVRSLAGALAAYLPPLIAHAVAAFPDGRARRRPAKAVVVTGYVVATVTAAARLLGTDPFLDLGCWADCTRNPWAVAAVSPGVFAALGWATAGTLAAAAVVGGTSARSHQSSRGPRVLAALAAGLVFVGAALHTLSAGQGSDDPTRREIAIAVGIGSVGAIMLGCGYLWAVLDSAVRRSRLQALATTSADDSLAATLARALGDPSLTVRPAGVADADRDGEPPVTRTHVQRSGRRVATIEHSADVVDLEREIGPALRLALENEALHLELDQQLASLRASRARVVATGDEHRRRLERDLHDGAQQHLVVLAALLRGARQRAQQRGDVEACPVLDAAVDEARAALGDLRELAHGLFPAVLVNEGIEAALRTMAISAALPIELEFQGARRAPLEVETTLYLVVQAVATDAADHGASHLQVRLATSEDAAVLELRDDRTEPARIPEHVQDRVGAVGGSMEVSPGGVHAIIPLGRFVPTAVTR